MARKTKRIQLEEEVVPVVQGRPDYISAPQTEGEVEPQHIALAKELAEIKAWKTLYSAKEKEKNKRLAEIELELNDYMDAKKIDLFRIPDLGTFSKGTKPYPDVVDKPSFIEWLDENEMSGLAPRTINFQTLAAWVKEMREGGREIPDSVNVWDKPVIYFTRPRGSKKSEE